MSKPFKFPKSSKMKSPVSPTYGRLSTAESEDDLELRPDEIGSFERHLSTWKLCALTCSVGGLQVLWAAIFTNGTSYLKALGLPENATALVWIAPPLCGCLLQPYFGSLSDSSQHSWGRRRPFILAGAIGITISALALGWSSLLAFVLASPLGTIIIPEDAQTITVIFAIVSIWTLSVAIQPFQCGIRTLIVDACPMSQQSSANIWAARFTALGNILGCVAGSFTFISEIARFRFLCGLAIVAVDITCAITCLSIREAAMTTDVASSSSSSGVLHTYRQLKRAYRTTPRTVREIFQTQTVAWLGWFGFLFYSSSYASDKFTTRIATYQEVNERTVSRGGQLGTLAALSLSVVSLIATNALPFLYRSPEAKPQALAPPEKPSGSFLSTVKRNFISMPNIWTMSLVAAAVIMLLSLFVTDSTGAIVLISSIGPSWAVASWAPFTLIGEALREDKAFDSEKGSSGPDYSGSIIGLHNIAMSAPQILAAGLCFVILSAADTLRSSDGIGWVFRVDSLAFLGAAVLAYRLSKDR